MILVFLLGRVTVIRYLAAEGMGFHSAATSAPERNLLPGAGDNIRSTSDEGVGVASRRAQSALSAVAGIAGIFLFNIDDLKTIADENLKTRLGEVEVAARMVEADAREFMEWYEGLAAVPAINRIQEKFEEIRRRELDRYRKKRLKHLSDEDFGIIEDLTNQIMTKTLHNPITHLKKYTGTSRGHRGERTIEEAVRIIMEMFEK